MNKYQPYSQYKDSQIGWIGAIPIDWNVKKTKYLFRITKRIAGVLGYDVLSITQKGIKVKDIESGEGQLSMDYSKYQLVEKGDFAMNHMDLLTGYVDISQFDGVISPDYRVFKLIDNECNPKYFLYLYQKAYWDKLFYPLGQGSSQLGRWRFPSDEFLLFNWPVPPKSEQSAITNFLDRKTAEIKRFIELKEKTIALLKERKTAIINHAVTCGLDEQGNLREKPKCLPEEGWKDSGIEWLGEIPKHWEVKKLKYLLSIKNGDGIPSDDIKEDGLYPVYGGNGLMGYYSKFNIDKPKIVIGRVGAKCGNVHLTNGPIWVNDNAMIVDAKFNYNYLRHILEAADLNRLNSSNAQPLITGSKVKNFSVAIATDTEVPAIIQFIEIKEKEINGLITQAEKEISLIKEYLQSLISEAVTGKIDVRGEI